MTPTATFIDKNGVRANALRAPRWSGFAPSQICVCLGHSATIDFRGGPAAEWLLERHDLAKQLNEESTREAALPKKRAASDK